MNRRILGAWLMAIGLGLAVFTTAARADGNGGAGGAGGYSSGGASSGSGTLDTDKFPDGGVDATVQQPPIKDGGVDATIHDGGVPPGYDAEGWNRGVCLPDGGAQSCQAGDGSNGTFTIPEVKVEGQIPPKKPAPKTNPKPKVSKAKTDLDQSSQGAGDAAQKMDGTTPKAPGSQPVVDAGAGQPLPDPKTPKGPPVATSDLGSPQTAANKGLVPPTPPKADPTVPAQSGDKADKPGFWDSTKGILKTVGGMVGQFGGFGGMMIFLFGVATFNPMLMLGGALAACGAVLLGGLAQAYL